MSINDPCPCGSGLSFGSCHATYAPPPHAGREPAPIGTASPPTLKLDLACGQSPRSGFDGVDFWYEGPEVKYHLNLLEYPWPWPDSSVAELVCSHFIEHIPMDYVDAGGRAVGIHHPRGQDALLRFFDEAWRVLVPDGLFEVVAPCAGSNRAFQDPTHRRFIPPEFYGYLSAKVRRDNRLDHYRVTCDFADEGISPIVPIDINALHPEVALAEIRTKRNVAIDWVAKLRAKKPS